MKTRIVKQLVSLQFAGAINEYSYKRFVDYERPEEASLQDDAEKWISGYLTGFDLSFKMAVVEAVRTETVPVLDWEPKGIQKMAWEAIVNDFESFREKYEVLSLVYQTKEIEQYTREAPEGFLDKGRGEFFEDVIYVVYN